VESTDIGEDKAKQPKVLIPSFVILPQIGLTL